jgi:hypothetical protein
MDRSAKVRRSKAIGADGAFVDGETRVEIAQGKVSRPHEQPLLFSPPGSNQLLQPIVAVAVLAASAGGLPPVVSITGAGRFQEPPAPPTALGVVVSSDEFQPT